MAKSDLLPGPAEPKSPALVPTTVTLDQENLDWLDGVADSTQRSRSDALREILRRVREQHIEPKDATPEPAASPS